MSRDCVIKICEEFFHLVVEFTLLEMGTNAFGLEIP